jgi:hypothetical protein
MMRVGGDGVTEDERTDRRTARARVRQVLDDERRGALAERRRARSNGRHGSGSSAWSASKPAYVRRQS